MSENRKTYEGSVYFVTLTVVGWIDVFTRRSYADIIIENLKFCQQNEGLIIYAYVIMSNHLHLVVKRDNEKDLNELLGRFKSYTSKIIIKEIEENIQESRKEWMLFMFKHYAKKNKQYKNYHFWQYTNHPIELYSNEVIDQKINYIHQNPVVAGIVKEDYQYILSSANPDSLLKINET